MASQQDQDFINELARKYGVSVENSDANTLSTKNTEDRNQFKRDLEAQYQRRAAPTSHRPHDSQTTNPQDQQANAAADTAKASGQQIQYAQPQGQSAGSSGGGGNVNAGQAVVQSWNQQPAQMDPTLKAMLESAQQERDALKAQMAAAETERKQRADSLFARLGSMANQTLAIDRNDPMIRQQADAYAANQQRAERDHLADIAEGAGPTANLLGEQRLMTERLGQATGTYEAGLISKELQARRDEIMQALQAQGAMLSADQQAELERQMKMIDSALAEQGIVLQNRGMDQDFGLGMAGLDVTRRGQDLQSQLGNRGLDMDWQRAMLNNDQFLRNLGFQYWDRDNYWKGVR